MDQPTAPLARANRDRHDGLWAGAATTDLTPGGSVFLYGYPHVRRYSSGVHDPLECGALYLRNGGGAALLLATDLIFVTKRLTAEVRDRITAATGLPGHAIMVTATHTHSGPVTADYLSNRSDPTVPKAEPAFLDHVAQQMVRAALAALQAAEPAEIGLARVQAAGVGTNRHDPSGPADRDVPVLVARPRAGGPPLACLFVYGMHPTVLHEDSTLISGDFPHFTRQMLRRTVLPATCPVLFLQGASGNQSPRHVSRANTFAEAQRLGENLGRTIAEVVPTISFQSARAINCRQAFLDLTVRNLPDAAVAAAAVQRAKERFERLKVCDAPRQEVRTAECDVFGAEETEELARAAASGRMAEKIRECLPAEIQLIEIGGWRFVSWPGEFFVEYALAVKARAPDTFVVTLANGELQGYIVTADAARRQVYESNNAVFAPENGARFVEATLGLLSARG